MKSVRDSLVALRDSYTSCIKSAKESLVRDRREDYHIQFDTEWKCYEGFVRRIDSIIAELDAAPIHNCLYCDNNGFRWGIGDSGTPINVPCPHCNHARRQEPISENSRETIIDANRQRGDSDR